MLIPVTDTALSIGAVITQLEADELGPPQRDALARAFERTVQTCALLVSYAVGVAGKAIQTLSPPSGCVHQRLPSR